MSDGDRFLAYENLFYQKPQDLLPFNDVQGLGTRSQPAPKIAERLDEAQIPGLITRGHLQRLQFGLDGLILSAQFRHSAAELLETHQAFLIRNQQSVHAFRQPRMIPAQTLLPLS